MTSLKIDTPIEELEPVTTTATSGKRPSVASIAAFFAGLGFRNCYRSAFNYTLIQFRNSFSGFFFIRHFNKTESAAATGKLVGYYSC